MPYAYQPGAEMAFSLVVRADISDAPNQEADASLAPVMPEEDWRFASTVGTWADTVTLTPTLTLTLTLTFVRLKPCEARSAL